MIVQTTASSCFLKTTQVYAFWNMFKMFVVLTVFFCFRWVPISSSQEYKNSKSLVIMVIIHLLFFKAFRNCCLKKMFVSNPNKLCIFTVCHNGHGSFDALLPSAEGKLHAFLNLYCILATWVYRLFFYSLWTLPPYARYNLLCDKPF